MHPNIDFAWIGSSPEMCEKTFVRSLKNCFSAKLQFSSSYCGNLFQVPKSTQILILRGLEAVQACAIFFFGA